jgi:hypothetical protein
MKCSTFSDASSSGAHSIVRDVWAWKNARKRDGESPPVATVHVAQRRQRAADAAH